MHRYIPLHFWSINIANKFLNQKYSIFVIRIFPDQKLFAIIPLYYFAFQLFIFVRSALAGNGNSARIIAHRQQRRIPSFCMHTVIPPIVNGKSILLLLSIHPLLSAFLPFAPFSFDVQPWPKKGQREGGKKEMAKATKAILLLLVDVQWICEKGGRDGEAFYALFGPHKHTKFIRHKGGAGTTTA